MRSALSDAASSLRGKTAHGSEGPSGLPSHLGRAQITAPEAPAGRLPWEEANNSAAPDIWDLIDANAACSPLERVRKCRRVRNSSAAHVEVQLRGDRASYGGLQTCGSVWACPACAAKVAAERAESLTGAVQRWHDEGGTWLLLTGTLRHHQRHRLVPLLDGLQPAWEGATQNRRPLRLLREMGFIGAVRTIEVTHGLNGWHPHVHALMAVSGSVTDEQVAEYEEAAYDAWAAKAERAGLPRPTRAHGLQVKRLDLSEALEEAAGYLLKEATDAATKRSTAKNAAHELTGEGQKLAAGRTAFGILRDIADLEDPDALALWREYSEATKGRRRMTWSRGLRERLGVGVERTDEEIAADTDREGRVMALLTAPAWEGIAPVRGRRGRLLAIVQTSPTPEDVFPRIARTLDAWGLPAPLPPDPPGPERTASSRT